MAMRVRTALTLLTARTRPPVDIHEVAKLPLRVWPSDVDVLRHMNNGVYLSAMDLGRFDLLSRSGLRPVLRAHQCYPVVTSETISFRRSLLPRQRYTLQTKITGYDATSIYVEQRFTVNAEIFAVGMVRSRMLRRGSGAIPIAELGRLLDIDVTNHTPPAWVTDWAGTVALPGNKRPYLDDWATDQSATQSATPPHPRPRPCPSAS